jgi:1-phosphofructokinase
MIFTLTANLLAETTAVFSHWSEGGAYRASSESFQVGGKGVNVAKMLARLGVPAKALVFTSGHIGQRCNAWLADQPFASHAFSSTEPTRQGLVVRAPGMKETTFLGPDCILDTSCLAECAHFLSGQPPGRCLAICGSIPGWSAQAWDPLRTVFEKWMLHSPLAVDTYGLPLAWFVQRPVYVLKINRQEFAGLFADSDSQRPTPVLLGEASKRWPVQRWIITDGPRAIWTAESGGETKSIVPPVVPEVSATGSGDVFFAGLLHGLLVRQRSFMASVADAAELGARNAASAGVADFPLPAE